MSEVLIVLANYNAFILYTGTVCGIDEVNAFGAVVVILMGGAMCLAGRWLLSTVTALVCGFSFGLIATAFALKTDSSLSSCDWASITIQLVASVLGMVFLCSRRVGGWIVGFCSGCTVAYVVYALVGERLSPDDPGLARLGLCVPLGVFGAAAVARFQEPALAVSSSMLRAAQVVLGLGHFVKDIPDADGLAAYRKQDHGPSLPAVPTAWWLYLSLFLALSVGGACLQLLTIAKLRGRCSRSIRPSDEYAVMAHV